MCFVYAKAHGSLSWGDSFKCLAWGDSFKCLTWADSFKLVACQLLGNYELLMNLVCLRVQLAFELAMLVLGNLSEFVVVTKGLFDESCFFEFD